MSVRCKKAGRGRRASRRSWPAAMRADAGRRTRSQKAMTKATEPESLVRLARRAAWRASAPLTADSASHCRASSMAGPVRSSPTSPLFPSTVIAMVGSYGRAVAYPSSRHFKFSACLPPNFRMSANGRAQSGPIEDSLEFFGEDQKRLVGTGRANELHTDRQLLGAPVERQREGGLPRQAERGQKRSHLRQPGRRPERPCRLKGARGHEQIPFFPPTREGSSGFVDSRSCARHILVAARGGAVHGLEEPPVEFVRVDRSPQTMLEPSKNMRPGCIADHAQRVSGLAPESAQYRGPSHFDSVSEPLQKTAGHVHAFGAVRVHVQSDFGVMVQHSDPKCFRSRGVNGTGERAKHGGQIFGMTGQDEVAPH